MADYNYLFKYIIVGDASVGKSCLLLQFTDKRFRAEHDMTIGVEFGHRVVEIDDQRIKLQIWDTAGQERFRTITQAYYRGAMGILLIYDVTNTKTWSNVRNWVRNIEGFAPQTVNKILVGNKSDVEGGTRVETRQARELAAEYGMKFLETSARSNINVSEAFMTLAEDVFERIMSSGGAQQAPSGVVELNQWGGHVKSGCAC